MVELVDTLDLGSSAERFESSSLSWGTIFKRTVDVGILVQGIRLKGIQR